MFRAAEKELNIWIRSKLYWTALAVAVGFVLLQRFPPSLLLAYEALEIAALLIMVVSAAAMMQERLYHYEEMADTWGLSSLSWAAARWLGGMAAWIIWGFLYYLCLELSSGLGGSLIPVSQIAVAYCCHYIPIAFFSHAVGVFAGSIAPNIILAYAGIIGYWSVSSVLVRFGLWTTPCLAILNYSWMSGRYASMLAGYGMALSHPYVCLIRIVYSFFGAALTLVGVNHFKQWRESLNLKRVRMQRLVLISATAAMAASLVAGAIFIQKTSDRDNRATLTEELIGQLNLGSVTRGSVEVTDYSLELKLDPNSNFLSGTAVMSVTSTDRIPPNLGFYLAHQLEVLEISFNGRSVSAEIDSPACYTVHIGPHTEKEGELEIKYGGQLTAEVHNRFSTFSPVAFVDSAGFKLPKDFCWYPWLKECHWQFHWSNPISKGPMYHVTLMYPSNYGWGVPGNLRQVATEEANGLVVHAFQGRTNSLGFMDVTNRKGLDHLLKLDTSRSEEYRDLVAFFNDLYDMPADTALDFGLKQFTLAHNIPLTPYSPESAIKVLQYWWGDVGLGSTPGQVLWGPVGLEFYDKTKTGCAIQRGIAQYSLLLYLECKLGQGVYADAIVANQLNYQVRESNGALVYGHLTLEQFDLITELRINGIYLLDCEDTVARAVVNRLHEIRTQEGICEVRRLMPLLYQAADDEELLHLLQLKETDRS